MPITAQGYFNALRTYLDAHYRVQQANLGSIELKDKIYLPGSTNLSDKKIKLVVSGEAIVVNLDKKNRNNRSEPLFHFLDDNARPWSKRCDFVVFHRKRERIDVYCIEFKSGSFPNDLPDQLKASESWCRALHSILKHYTGESKKMRLMKFVFSCHQAPAAYLDPSGKYINRDLSIRHHNYDYVDGKSLDDLDNVSVQIIG